MLLPRILVLIIHAPATGSPRPPPEIAPLLSFDGLLARGLGRGRGPRTVPKQQARQRAPAPPPAACVARLGVSARIVGLHHTGRG